MRAGSEASTPLRVADLVLTTPEYEADATLENEATDRVV